MFVDTSAIYAGIDGDDAFHERAVEEWSRFVGGEETLVTHALVEVETAALVQRRLGTDALRALREVLLPRLSVIEIDRAERREAIARTTAAGRREVSVVDHVSFDVMRRAGISRAFTFDRHFADAGFELVGPG